MAAPLGAIFISETKMTVASDVSRVEYQGDGQTILFTVPFRFLLDGDIAAILRDGAGAEHLWVLNSDYALSGQGEEAGGQLTASTAPGVGEKLVIVRDVSLVQQTEFPENGPFPASASETAHDRAIMVAQQLAEALDRTLQLAVTTDAEVTAKLPSPDGGKVIGWDASGTALVNLDLAVAAIAEFVSGTAGLPGLRIAGDADTGIYSNAEDSLQVAVGGQAAASFRRGVAVLYSGDDPPSSDFAFSLRNEVPNAELDGTAIASLTYQAKSAEGDNQYFVQLEGHAANAANASLAGRYIIKLRDGPETSDQVEILDAKVTHAEAGVPFRYVSSIEASDLTNQSDFASVEKVGALIAEGAGQPFPLHLPLLGTVGDGTYPILTKTKHAFTINGVTLKAGAGSGTVALTKNGSNVAGLAALGATTSASDHTPAGNGTEGFPIDAAMAVVISGASGLSNLTIDIDAELTA